MPSSITIQPLVHIQLYAQCRSTIMNSRQFLYTANWAVVSTIHYMMLQNTHYVQINSLLSLWPIKAFKGDG